MIPYILHVALLLTACLLFYKLLLQKETFYRANRYFLLLCLVFSFTLPLIRVPAQWSLQNEEHVPPALMPHIIISDPSNDSKEAVRNERKTSVVEAATLSNSSTTEKWKNWIFYLYWFGVALFLINFLIQLGYLLYQAYSCPHIKDGKYRIVEVKGDKAPCSFASYIFINPERYDWDTYSQILLHEKLHVRGRHSLDLLFSELLLVFQWFNPFAWLYRKEVETNLEYLTDHHLLERREVEKASYQMSLLKVSAPHRPLRITTNYNQSLLKKRILMMNAKQSNLHTAWKYGFMLPVMVLSLALLNKPVAIAQEQLTEVRLEKKETGKGLIGEGSWFATIKGDKVSIQFKSDEDEHSFNNSSFQLSEFSTLPRDKQGEFTLKREAGTMQFTGKFEGEQGMGRYKFSPEADYTAYLRSQNIGSLEEHDLLAFFFTDIKKGYLDMLKEQGYRDIKKDELIPLAALKVDAPFIKGWKESGFKALSAHELVTLKSLNISQDYLQEIKKAGYNDLSVQQLISFKAQGISGKYIEELKAAKSKAGKASETSAEDIVAAKAMQIDPAYIKSMEAVGYSNIADHQLMALKSLNITPEFIKSFQSIGYKDVSVTEIIALKSQNISPDYVKSFEQLGFKDIRLLHIIPLKSLGVTPAYIRQFQDLGFTNASLEDLLAVKASGITSDFVASMQQKGINYSSLQKYIQLKQMQE